MSFEKLDLIEPILKALKNKGYTHPTAIQEQAIPIILNRDDLLGCAQTGTGKTAAYALPILQILHAEPVLKGKRPIRAVILSPTRELAIQISENIAEYGRFTGLRHTVILGGVNQGSQVRALQAGVDIVIATPGRLLDLINQRYISLQSVSMFVLDEADRMLDMGFIDDVEKIVNKLPRNRQTLFFSATMPSEIQHLADEILDKPKRVEIVPTTSNELNIEQSIYYVEKMNKRALLLHLLKDNVGSALIFSKTKNGANKIVKDLQKAGISTDAIHGNKSQMARVKALQSFKNKKVRVLVATDIVARGIDVDHLSLVVNYDIPNNAETYVHRIGRTGRAGASGLAYTFCDEEEMGLLKGIIKFVNKPITVVENHPFPMDPSLRMKSSPQKKRSFSRRRY